MDDGTGSSDVLTAPYVLEYPYHRSTGRVTGAFLGGLAERRVLGARTKSGRIIVPPQEYDPDTGEEIEEMVDAGTSGVVTSWTWITQPRKNHPLQRPFAFALVRLDGADTAMLHAVDAGSPDRMRTGMRVRVRWRDDPQGAITDIACFEPEDG
jgi:uncharacterized OB-fold protein